VYASVGASDLNYPNSLVAISAEGAVEWSVFVGSDPGHVAVADDGTAVYVSLDGAGAVREVDPATGAATNQFAVGIDSFMGTMYATDLLVLPGQARSVALVPRAGAYSQGVYVFDDGVRRGGLTPEDSWATHATGVNYGSDPDVIVAASDSMLYGYVNSSSSLDFEAIAVSATGLEITALNGSLFGGSDIAYSSGKVFSTSGAVLDPSGPSLLGTLPLGEVWEGPVLPSPAGDYAYFLMAEAVSGSPWGADHVVLMCNVGTFTCSSRIVLMWQQNAVDALRIVRWGERGIAALFTGWLLLEPDVLP
jgi:DNA-binding beta-propeller fold protein YncE